MSDGRIHLKYKSNSIIFQKFEKKLKSLKDDLKDDPDNILLQGKINSLEMIIKNKKLNPEFLTQMHTKKKCTQKKNLF